MKTKIKGSGNCPEDIQEMGKHLFKKIYYIPVRTVSLWHVSHGPLPISLFQLGVMGAVHQLVVAKKLGLISLLIPGWSYSSILKGEDHCHVSFCAAS